MTAISRAALPPTQPHVTEAQRLHPRFQEYQQYRSAMSALLVEAPSFYDWLRSSEVQKRDALLEAHPRFNEFQGWMQATRGGAPGKTDLRWPENFHAWLDGKRW